MSKVSSLLSSNFFLYSLLLSTIAISAIFLFLGDLKIHAVLFLSLYILVYLIYALISFIVVKRKNIYLLPFILTSLAISSFYIFIQPRISRDIYSYLMDGWLTSSGVNPFLLPPSNPSLVRFHQNEIYKLDVWRDTTTIYPPVALSIFSLEYLLYQELGMVGAKIMFIFPAVLLAVLFYKLFGRKVFVLFILNPLLLFETFSSGHLEVWAALFAFVSLKLYFSKRFNLSAGFLSLGILTKLFPLLMLPFLAFSLFKLKLEKLLTFLMIIFGISFVFYLPFLKTASYKPITRNIFIPLQHEFNSTFFRLIKSLMSNFISNPQISIHISSLVCVSLLSLIIVYLMRKKFSVGICIITMISFLLLSPIAYAWYTIFLMCLIFWFVDSTNKYWIIFFLIYMQVLISLTYASEITSLTIYQVSSLMRVIAVVEVISLVAFAFLYKYKRISLNPSSD